MKIQIQNNGYNEHEQILLRNLEDRIPIEISKDKEGMLIDLSVNAAIGPEESYQIEKDSAGWKIIGSDAAGLYYGIGKYLHTAKWTENRFIPSSTRRVSTPDCSFRATYFSVHFYNWYYMAPSEELKKYIEEMLLWGYNAIISIIPVVNIEDFEDSEWIANVERIRAIFKIAKKLNMKVGLTIPANQGLKSTPKEFMADLSCYDNRCTIEGKNICPSIPGAMDYMRFLWDMILKQFVDIGLDYIISWPYDEGGCGCEKCRPWGAKGFAAISRELCKEARHFYPQVKLIYSTWYFDLPIIEGEYEGLYARLKDIDMDYIDYLMVDAHNKFPEFVLTHEIIKPIVNFPEISMFCLRPWGGRGANPALKRFQGFWDTSKQVLDGGMPYSEGNYEDITKVQFAGYYWDKNCHYREIMKEYIGYEYAAQYCDEILEMMELIEENHIRVSNQEEPILEYAARVNSIALEIDRNLGKRAKKAWRWRVLYIRARIDWMVYEYYQEKGRDYYLVNNTGRKWLDADGTIVQPGERISALGALWRTPVEYLEDNPEAQKLLWELCSIYHCDLSKASEMATLPPVKI